jgi:alanyl-tRNA synthetase
MTGNEIRRRFLDYFKRQRHEEVPSSALVPHNDDTLLFTNAGMVQFKEVFLGIEQRRYRRATSSQRCVRAGGKHNDLENVGHTARHLTCFEMLGNFSFGDYFKREAIGYGWEFLIDEMQLDPERLYATVYEQDDESFELFRDICGLPAERVIRCGAKDNFWAMGETGPCGPCAEFHYDRGPRFGGDELLDPASEGDRLVEIWNLVFMQYDRDAAGHLTPLPEPCIDTGMGLERLCAVLNDLESVYSTDLLLPLVEHAAELAGRTYGTGGRDDVSLRVIADHARSTTFLISDGVLPSNEWRGYVLRRIMRRALRHGRLLGIDGPFFHQVCGLVVEMFKDAYPELLDTRHHVANVVKNEEERFGQTLKQGLEVLERKMQEVREAGGTVLPGEDAFFLHDTYGFSLDLTREIVQEEGLTVDEAGYQRGMDEQVRRAREAHHAGAVTSAAPIYHTLLQEHGPTRFTGYQETEADVQVIALARDNHPVEQAESGEKVEIFLDQTPFYAESGGQVGDVGTIALDGTRVEVLDTKPVLPGFYLHRGRVIEGTLRPGESGRAVVDLERRRAIARHHTATHILQWALRQVLGDHVRQSGSLVAPDRLRFDFTHFAALTAEELRAIERLVNQRIAETAAVGSRAMGLREAMESGAVALFGEKYGEEVRVIEVGDWSRELCGGIHVQNTGEIGSFLITREESVAAGIRRIEAVTGAAAAQTARDDLDLLHELGGLLNAGLSDLPERVRKLQQQVKGLEKEISRLKEKLASAQSRDPLEHVDEAAGIKYVTVLVEGMEAAHLRNLADELKQKLGSGVVVVGTASEGAATLVAGVTADLTGRVKAGDLVKRVAQLCGGGGGGRPDLAQAGGKQPEKLPEALAAVGGIIEELAG